jgi:hypothetical protein
MVATKTEIRYECCGGDGEGGKSHDATKRQNRTEDRDRAEEGMLTTSSPFLSDPPDADG